MAHILLRALLTTLVLSCGENYIYRGPSDDNAGIADPVDAASPSQDNNLHGEWFALMEASLDECVFWGAWEPRWVTLDIRSGYFFMGQHRLETLSWFEEANELSGTGLFDDVVWNFHFISTVDNNNNARLTRHSHMGFSFPCRRMFRFPDSFRRSDSTWDDREDESEADAVHDFPWCWIAPEGLTDD